MTMAAGHARTTFRPYGIGLLMTVLMSVCLLLSALPALAAPAFPPLSGRVTDAANILPAETLVSIDSQLADLEKTTSTQLVVATVPDLQGLEIEEYGYQLGRAWGIGQKGTNNGALLIVAPNERKVRIEVGYGLEGVLTDALTSQIIRRDIIPHFKAGDMAGGVQAGAQALVKLLALPPGEQAQAAQAAASEQAQRQHGGGGGFGTFVWILIVVLWLVFSIARRRRGFGAGPVILWGPGGGGWGSGGGGGWGGGGGGGFSGGGGSFGGGGSSGSW